MGPAVYSLQVVNYFITAFYDGALYLAESYNRTIQDGGSIDDGIAVAQRMWNATYEGLKSTTALRRKLSWSKCIGITNPYYSMHRTKINNNCQAATVQKQECWMYLYDFSSNKL